MFPHPTCNPFIHNIQYLNPLYRLRRETHVKVLQRKAIERLIQKRKDHINIPFRVSLRILNTYLILSTKKKCDLTEFFGYFVKDSTRTVFQIFFNFDVVDDDQMESLPTTLRGFDYWWVRNYLIMPYGFLKTTIQLERLVGHVILDDHTLGAVNKDTIENLYFYCDLFNIKLLTHLNQMQHLKKLTVFPKEHNLEVIHLTNISHLDPNTGQDDLHLQNLLELRMSNVPTTISFQYTKSLTTLFIEDTILDDNRLYTITNLPNLREVTFWRCSLEQRYAKIFEHRCLQKVNIFEGQVDANALQKCKIPVFETKLTTIKLRKVYHIQQSFFVQCFKIKKLELLEVRECNIRVSELLNTMLEKKKDILWNGIKLDIRAGNIFERADRSDYNLMKKVEKEFLEGKNQAIRIE